VVTLTGVQGGTAALALELGALAVLAGWLLARRPRAKLSPAVGALLVTVPDALGDAAFLLDGEGRVVAANAEAVRLAGPQRAAAGSLAENALGPDLALLRRGLAGGPCSAVMALPSAAGAGRVQAVLLRVAARPARDLLVLRPMRAPSPPPLPARAPPPLPAARAAAAADLGAVGAALRGPVGRASTSAALLRLALPALAAGPAGELIRLEEAIAELERRVGALLRAGAAGTGHPRALDLAALVEEVAGGLPVGPRLRVEPAPARVLADEGRVRAALREVLRAAAGGSVARDVSIRVGARGGSAFLELTSDGAGERQADAAALARALLAPEGARVEVEAVPGRGRVCRIALPALNAAAEPP
jgi:hypothetical protein